MDAIKKGRKAQLTSIVAMAYLHLRRGYLQPIVVHAIVGLISLIQEPLVQIYLLGRPAEGALSRPFQPRVPAWIKVLLPPINFL